MFLYLDMLYDYILALHVELGDNLIKFIPKDTFYDIHMFPHMTYLLQFFQQNVHMLPHMSLQG